MGGRTGQWSNAGGVSAASIVDRAREVHGRRSFHLANRGPADGSPGTRPSMDGEAEGRFWGPQTSEGETSSVSIESRIDSRCQRASDAVST